MFPYHLRSPYIIRLLSDDVTRLFLDELELPQWIYAAWESFDRFFCGLYIELEYWQEQIPRFAQNLLQAVQGKRPADTRLFYQQITGFTERAYAEHMLRVRGKLRLFGSDTPLEYLIDMQGTYATRVSWIFLRCLLTQYVATMPQRSEIPMTDIYEKAKDLYDAPEPAPMLPGFMTEGLLDGLDQDLTNYLEGYYGDLSNFGRLLTEEIRLLYAEGVRASHIQSVIVAAREGRIAGEHFLHRLDQTGCAYAFLRMDLTDSGAYLNYIVMKKLCQDYTPLERLVQWVRAQQTPETSYELALLIQIMERFLAALPAEVPATTTMEETHA